MLPGNSFPQICVVSMDQLELSATYAQEYLRTMPQSNHWIGPFSNVLPILVLFGLPASLRTEGLAQGGHGKLNAVVGARLAHQATDVGLDGAFLNAQLLGDFPVGASQEDEFHHLPFAGR